MDRRTFGKLAGFAAMSNFAKTDALASTVGRPETDQPNVSNEAVLEDEQLLVAFDRTTGAITDSSERQPGGRFRADAS